MPAGELSVISLYLVGDSFLELVKTLINSAKIALFVATALFLIYGWYPVEWITVAGACLLPLGLLLALIFIAISIRLCLKSPPESEEKRLAFRSLILHGACFPVFLLYGFLGINEVADRMLQTEERIFSPFGLRVADVRNLGDSGGPPIVVSISYSFIPYYSFTSGLYTEVFRGYCYSPNVKWGNNSELSITVKSCSEKPIFSKSVGSVAISVVEE